MSKLGLALIGCGRMGCALAAVIKEHVPDGEVVVGCDPFPGSREEFTRATGAPATASLEEALAREEIGAVIIASPNHLHCDQTVAAAVAGKHVFCEKPMALLVADCDRMIAACDAAGVKLMVGHNTRLHPLCVRLREVAAGGELGEPRYGYANYFFDGFKDRQSGAWHLDRAHSGGLLFHMGIHQIDLFHAIFGPTKRVQYAGNRCGAQVHDFDDIATILMQFHSGATGVLSVSSLAAVPTRNMQLLFSRGYALLDGPYTWLEYAHRDSEPTRVEAAGLSGRDATQAELSSFVGWVLRGECPLLTAAEGRAAVAVAEAAERARETGGPAEVAAE